MPMSTAPSRPICAPRSSSGRQSLSRVVLTASLMTSAPVARIACACVVRSPGTPLKSCDRQHDAPAGGFGEEIGEIRFPLDVHVVGAARQRLPEDPSALVLRSRELPAFPRRTARHDDRQTPAGQRAGHVRIADRIETQLDQVGTDDLVALAAELGHRWRGHGDAEQCVSHK